MNKELEEKLKQINVEKKINKIKEMDKYIYDSDNQMWDDLILKYLSHTGKQKQQSGNE